jgi:hypothetical protein
VVIVVLVDLEPHSWWQEQEQEKREKKEKKQNMG